MILLYHMGTMNEIAVFEILQKTEAKKPFFSCTITILDHTLYCKVETFNLISSSKICSYGIYFYFYYITTVSLIAAAVD